MNIEVGKLYFVRDEFYERFRGYGLLENKDEIDGQSHNRPCCCLFNDRDYDTIYWFVPISSQLKKYNLQYEKSIKKYKMCDNISFGYVLGNKTAFLPQNLFPITVNYINNAYIDNNTLLPITLSSSLMSELSGKSRKKIRYNKQGRNFGLSDAIGIYQELISDEIDKGNPKVLVGSIN